MSYCSKEQVGEVPGACVSSCVWEGGGGLWGATAPGVGGVSARGGELVGGGGGVQ